MGRRVILWSIAVIVMACGGGGLLMWQKAQRDAKRLAFDQVATAPSSDTVPKSDSPPIISGDFQNQVLTQSSTSQANQSTRQTNTTSNNGVTIDPNQFTQYERYKGEKEALFADLMTGDGAEATSGKKLSVNYRGWLTTGQVFDQSADASKPYQFVMGQHQVIAGWEQGLYGMKVGGERLLIVPPAAGFGNVVQGPIPANSVLVFDVKLLGAE